LVLQAAWDKQHAATICDKQRRDAYSQGPSERLLSLCLCCVCVCVCECVCLCLRLRLCACDSVSICICVSVSFCASVYLRIFVPLSVCVRVCNCYTAFVSSATSETNWLYSVEPYFKFAILVGSLRQPSEAARWLRPSCCLRRLSDTAEVPANLCRFVCLVMLVILLVLGSPSRWFAASYCSRKLGASSGCV